jgi:hypothetical protein
MISKIVIQLGLLRVWETVGLGFYEWDVLTIICRIIGPISKRKPVVNIRAGLTHAFQMVVLNLL